ncbi:MAG: family 20 glycosylhydrolase [Clostridia bacterium]|nr:family 20 glycosylhydrolase [Clostridia bacterium]
MKLFPKPKKIIPKDTELQLGKFSFIWPENVDYRLPAAAEKLIQFTKSFNGETKVYVSYADNDCDDLAFNAYQGYTLEINVDSISITADSAHGAFYGLITLQQILKNGKTVQCTEISDTPDMIHRGFYHDVSRGRVPKLETLKKLVDTLAYAKCNSLQIYFEHTYDFEEYRDFNAHLGYMTADEVKELDKYCYDNFIELIPSLATIGHMYSILQSQKYLHLCEYEIYTPFGHIWKERMLHHSIDVSNPESIKLIKSLIDQLGEVFHSRYFNLCGDETFDLAKGRNKGKDAGECYITFANKIIEHIKSKNKIAMIWGDILNKNPQNLSRLPDDVIVLNWTYTPDKEGRDFEGYKRRMNALIENGKKQLVAPATWTYNRLYSEFKNSVPNIINVIDEAHANGINGVLNTNWGDTGHLANLENSFYTLCLGAEKAWNTESFEFYEFSENVSALVFDAEEDVYPVLYEIENNQSIIMSVWFAVFHFVDFVRALGIKQIETIYTEDEVLGRIASLEEVISKISAMKMREDLKQKSLQAARGNLAFYRLTLANIQNVNTDSAFEEIQNWFEKFKADWLKENKPGELYIFELFLKEMEVYLSIK